MPLRAFSILQIVSFLILMIVCRLFSIPVYVECAFLLAIPGLQLLFAGQHPDYFVRTDYRLVRVNRLAEQKTIVPDSVPLVREDGSVNVPQLIFQLGQMLPHHLRVPVLSGTASGHHFCHLSCSDLELRGRDCGDLSGEEEF